MEVTNNKKILSAKPLYPELMAPNAEEKLINLFNELVAKKDELAKVYIRYNTLENEILVLRTEYNNLSKLFDITFDKKTIQEHKENCNLGIVNKEDARNW